MFRAVRQSPATQFCLALCSLFTVPEAYGQPFSTVINIPPDRNIGREHSIGSDTQLNLFDGGMIGAEFLAGASDGTSTNIEVNIAGGVVDQEFFANRGSTVNISSGSVGHSFEASSGSKVNVTGGSIGDFFQSWKSTVNITGGTIGNRAHTRFGELIMSGGSIGEEFLHFDGRVTINAGSIGDRSIFGRSTVDIHGGDFGRNFSAGEGATINILGGRFGDDFRATSSSTVNIFGGSFGSFRAEGFGEVNLFGTHVVLGGVEITSSLTLLEPLPIQRRDVTLSGRLADGSAFSFDLNHTSMMSQDFFSPSVNVTVTRVVPEPSCVVLLIPVLGIACVRRLLG